MTTIERISSNVLLLKNYIVDLTFYYYAMHGTWGNTTVHRILVNLLNPYVNAPHNDCSVNDLCTAM